MTEELKARVWYWMLVVAVGLAAAASWAVYLLIQPACGAPGNTALGRSNRWVPWALLVSEIIVVAVVGKLLRRQISTIIGGVVAGSLVAALAAVVVFVFWFGAGDCGE